MRSRVSSGVLPTGNFTPTAPASTAALTSHAISSGPREGGYPMTAHVGSFFFSLLNPAPTVRFSWRATASYAAKSTSENPRSAAPDESAALDCLSKVSQALSGSPEKISAYGFAIKVLIASATGAPRSSAKAVPTVPSSNSTVATQKPRALIM